VLNQLVEGEAAVIKPGGDTKFEVVGRITVDKWAQRGPRP